MNLQQQTALRHTDEICLNTTWPWVLQPESSFLNLWESIVFLTVLYVALVYPYEICYERYISNIIGLTTVVVNMVYVLDILIQLCSAIEDDQGRYSVHWYNFMASFKVKKSRFCMKRKENFYFQKISYIFFDHLATIIYLPSAKYFANPLRRDD